MSAVYQGRCWKLPHRVSNDQMMSSKFVFDYDLDILRANCLADVVPEFPRSARSGDVIVAGHQLAHGSLHIHPFLALQAMGIGILYLSMPRSSFRLAVYAGVNLARISEPVYEQIADGDRIEVNFDTGHVSLTDRDLHATSEPLAPFLREIVEAGGGLAYMRQLSQRESRPQAQS